jgi:hypothetical protein
MNDRGNSCILAKIASITKANLFSEKKRSAE